LPGSTPKHLIKVWTSKRLPGSLDRWTVSGNLHVQSRTSHDGAYCPAVNCKTGVWTYRAMTGWYRFADVRASYQIDANWQAALSVNNIFDGYYPETLGGPNNENWHGEPRNVLFRVEATY
jgi:outer membrane receptor for ferric coprogen and ferric-rhodotorulic acid